MLRGIWSLLVLLVVTTALALASLPIALLVPQASDVVWWAGRVWAHVMLRTVGARVRYCGLERLAADTPYIYIANHQSMIDVWALIRILPPSTRFVAKRELFRIPVFGWAMSASGFIPIDRDNRAAAMHSLERAAARIRAGRSVILFPEGTRSRDGRLAPFKKGAFHLALAAGVPVVPVTITGSFSVMPPGTVAVRPGPVEVVFDQPIAVEPFLPGDHRGLMRRVRDVIAARIDEPTAVPGAPGAQRATASRSRRISTIRALDRPSP